jgi:hypothetical protein
MKKSFWLLTALFLILPTPTNAILAGMSPEGQGLFFVMMFSPIILGVVVAISLLIASIKTVIYSKSNKKGRAVFFWRMLGRCLWISLLTAVGISAAFIFIPSHL